MIGSCRFFLAVTGFGALFTALAPPAWSQWTTCSSGEACDVGKWAGPWDWNSVVCSSYLCDSGASVEPYHGGLVPVGLHAGKALILRANVGATCAACPPGSPFKIETWLFDPGNPTTLIRVQHPDVPDDFECGGHTWTREGRFLIAGGVGVELSHKADTAYEFDPSLLRMVEYPDGYVPVCICPGPFVHGALCWTPLGSLQSSHYYPTLIKLIRKAITSGGLSDGIAGAVAVIGGPLGAGSDSGQEVWELRPPGSTDWTVQLLPDGFFPGPGTPPDPPGSVNHIHPHNAGLTTSNTEQYLRKAPPPPPDVPPPSPLLDSYGRAHQLGDPATGQVFIAGDTRTIASKSLATYGYGIDRTGKETFVMVIPYGPAVKPWELWSGQDMAKEHDYGGSCLLFTRHPVLGLQPNRVLVLGGQRWVFDTVTSEYVVEAVNDAVREYVIPGDQAQKGSWIDKFVGLLFPRVYANCVILPDGTILVVGGTSAPSTRGSGVLPEPVFQPEIYDPGALPSDPGTSKLMAPSPAANWPGFPNLPVPRLYHSMAMLLPDGRVFVFGGRIEQSSSAPTFPDSRLSGEIFYPPYLFEDNDSVPSVPAQQPVIEAAPASQDFETAFDVTVQTFEGPVKKVTLLRPASVTHHFDSDQRYIELLFTGGGGTGLQTISVSAPDQDMGPEGYYMLFVLEQKPTGKLVPSVAKLIQFRAP